MMRLGGMYRVEPDSRVGAIVLFGQLNSRERCIVLRPDDIYADFCIKRSLNCRILFSLICRKVEVCMCVKVLHSLRGKRFSGFLFASTAVFMASLVFGMNGWSMRAIR